MNITKQIDSNTVASKLWTKYRADSSHYGEYQADTDYGRFKSDIAVKYDALIGKLKAANYTEDQIVSVIMEFEKLATQDLSAMAKYHGMSVTRVRNWLIKKAIENIDEAASGKIKKDILKIDDYKKADGTLDCDMLINNIVMLGPDEFNDVFKNEMGIFSKSSAIDYKASKDGWDAVVGNQDKKCNKDDRVGIITFCKRIQRGSLVATSSGTNVWQTLSMDNVVIVPKKEFSSRIETYLFEMICKEIDDQEKNMPKTQRDAIKKKVWGYIERGEIEKLFTPEMSKYCKKSFETNFGQVLIKTYQSAQADIKEIDDKLAKVTKGSTEEGILTSEREDLIMTMYSCVGVNALYGSGQSIQTLLVASGGEGKELEYNYDNKIKELVDDFTTDGLFGWFSKKTISLDDFNNLDAKLIELGGRDGKHGEIFTLKMDIKSKKEQLSRCTDKATKKQLKADIDDLTKRLNLREATYKSLVEIKLVKEAKEEYFKMIKGFLITGSYSGDLNLRNYIDILEAKEPVGKDLDTYLKKNKRSYTDPILMPNINLTQ